MRRAYWVLPLLLVTAGCLGTSAPQDLAPGPADAVPFLGYKPEAPDPKTVLSEIAFLLPGAGVDLHARVVRPAGPGPFPVIVQFTPYTAPGRNAPLQSTVEPLLEPTPLKATESRFVTEFVRRGYAFVFADARGTGDSSGCLDLRGKLDVADLDRVTEYFGTQPWSNGRVGFIGASYPGSEAHMAGIANNRHLAAIVPVVASTSFYHYHHNDGVPYNGNHALGGTNAGYTQNALAPTANPQYPNYAARYLQELSCPHKENVVDHGGWDQSGTYDDWWRERNLRPRAPDIRVPVLMAQGLADWNVKPDHIATWFNDLHVPKTLIAGQWGHQYPRDAEGVYAAWWEYVTAFFDTHLKGIDTGMFGTSVAWVQDNADAWHRSASWPLAPDDADRLTLHLRPDLSMAAEGAPAEARLAWYGCPNDRWNRGTALGNVEDLTVACKDRTDQELVFESPPLAEDTWVSGVPLVRLQLQSRASATHLVAVLARVGPAGNVVAERENYGYLNPAFRDGLDSPREVPVEPYAATIDLYPQEDVVRAGERLRLTLRSDDGGRTIEAFEPGENEILFGPGATNTLELPLRPAAWRGVRLG